MDQKQGRILIADDEELFLDTLADILKREGFECDSALDSDAAKTLIQKYQYDLLIADIKMPGNEELEFIREVPDLARDLPVILVTAFPSIETALPAFKLPVAAYLCKPLDFDDLMSNVHTTIRRSRIMHAVRDTQQQLQKWADELDNFWDPDRRGGKADSQMSLETYLTLAVQNIAGSLLNMKMVLEVVGEKEVKFDICKIFDCPRAERLSEGIKKSIKVVEKTKKSFKSKELAVLRDELKDLVVKEGL